MSDNPNEADYLQAHNIRGALIKADGQSIVLDTVEGVHGEFVHGYGFHVNLGGHRVRVVVKDLGPVTVELGA